MADRWLIVSVAGLGFHDLELRGLTRMAGLDFFPASTVFPAVTCTVQASFRTASEPREHGMTFNGVFSRTMRKAAFWEQSSGLVEGGRIWDDARRKGKTVGMFFWQQSLGESVDCIVSPAPIHKHGGGAVMDCYILPDAVGAKVRKTCGTFPLHRYWGPLAHPNVGDKVADMVESALEAMSPDILLVYLPSLDYDLQRFGPSDCRTERSFRKLSAQLERLAGLAGREDRGMLVFGDYAITEVSLPPAFPNRTLRKAGLFSVRDVRGRAYQDLFSSRAFAMADHEIAHVFIRDPHDIPLARSELEATGDYSEIIERSPERSWGHPGAGELVLIARKGSWIAYPWWTDRREAPDYAAHIDIHSKPGYDPCELFFDRFFPPATCRDATRIKGTHGRNTEKVAVAASVPGMTGAGGITAIAEILGARL